MYTAPETLQKKIQVDTYEYVKHHRIVLGLANAKRSAAHPDAFVFKNMLLLF